MVCTFKTVRGCATITGGCTVSAVEFHLELAVISGRNTIPSSPSQSQIQAVHKTLDNRFSIARPREFKLQIHARTPMELNFPCNKFREYP